MGIPILGMEDFGRIYDMRPALPRLYRQAGLQLYDLELQLSASKYLALTLSLTNCLPCCYGLQKLAISRLRTVCRKNYIFAYSHQAVKRAAMIRSLFATCRLQYINLYYWLKNELQRMRPTRLTTSMNCFSMTD